MEISSTTHYDNHRGSLKIRILALIAVLLAVPLIPIAAQDEGGNARSDAEAAAEAAADEEIKNIPNTTPGDDADKKANTSSLGAVAEADLDLFQMFKDGGWPMVPIVVMLIVAITFTIERALGLRRSKVIPEALNREFGRLTDASSGFDPRKAYRVCQENPSAASSVIRTMLLKIGRPHSEVEHAVSEANDREAARLYSNVRWLNLAAAVSPLMGLFGTVWGMIKAFYAMGALGEDASKATFLAEGIVLALVTTLAGLVVAIPSAIAAHYFEGRIQNLFHEIDELLFTILPQVERFEGKLRVNHEHLGDGQPDDGELAIEATLIAPSTAKSGRQASGKAAHAGKKAAPVPPPVAETPK